MLNEMNKTSDKEINLMVTESDRLKRPSQWLVLLLLLVTQWSLAQDTSLNMISEAGDFVGQGQTYSLDESDGTFTADINFDGGINFDFVGPSGSFGVSFAPKENTPFIIGPYPDARRFPFQSPLRAGLDASGFGRGCNNLFGSFDVLEIETDVNNDVIRFAADFVQHCETEDAPSLTGSVRFNSAGMPFPPVPDADDDTVPDTIDNCIGDANLNQLDDDRDAIGNVCDDFFNDTILVLDSETGDFIGQGLFQEFYMMDGNFNASRNFDNGVTIQFDGDDSWTVNFAALGEVDLTIGSYEMATRFPFQDVGEPGMSISGAGRGCNALSGRFDVLKVIYDTQGEVEAFEATFEQRCFGSKPALFGEVKYNALIDLIFADDFE